MKNVTLVLGASTNPARYSYKAISSLRQKKIKVEAIGVRKGVVSDVKIETDKIEYDTIDTVTLYLNPKRQESYYEYILSLQPRRVIFNPGTENREFENLLENHNIISEVACTLVLLATNQY